MAKITIENEGRVTVIENALDWQIWDTEDVDGLVADFKITLSDEEKQKLYCGVHHQAFKLDYCCEFDDLYEIVIDELSKLGYLGD